MTVNVSMQLALSAGSNDVTDSVDRHKSYQPRMHRITAGTINVQTTRHISDRLQLQPPATTHTSCVMCRYMQVQWTRPDD